MKNLNNLIQLTKKANLQSSELPVKKEDLIFKLPFPQTEDYSASFNQPLSYTLGESSKNALPTHIVDTRPVAKIDDKRQVTVKEEPNVSLNRGLLELAFNLRDPNLPITIFSKPEGTSKPDKTKEKKLAWYETLENWIKENPWAAGAGALGLGGLGYYLLSDDDDEEEEEEE